MSHRIYTSISTKKTPQTQKVLGKNQVQNNAGGYVFALDEWKRLQRFLVLGSDSSTYYVSAHELTKDNANVVIECIKQNGKKTVDTIVSISDTGRAAKNDPAIFALAMCAGLGDAETRKYALENLDKVCRIGTHLFHFAQYVEQFRGWGAGLRKAIGRWYTNKPIDKLQLQLVKYRQRDGWSHRDLLRLAHPKATDVNYNTAFKWAVAKDEFVLAKEYQGTLSLIWAYEALKKETDEKEIINLITKYRLPMEAVASEKQTKAVLEALLPNMGLTGIIRNLGSYTNKGILDQHSESTKFVIEKLLNAENIKKARVHPITILAALRAYQGGHGLRGSLSWTPVGRIVDALDDAFYLAFENVEPTGKRFFLGLDISGSMTYGDIAGMIGLTPRVASAAMAMVTMKSEKDWGVYGFHNNLMPLSLSPKMRLDAACTYIDSLGFGGTDCSLPMLFAKANKIPVDAFVVYTDNETYAGRYAHPFQALAEYRQTMGIPARMIVVGMTSTGFSIADPSDAGSLDIVGFSTDTPQVISDFAAGKI